MRNAGGNGRQRQPIRVGYLTGSGHTGSTLIALFMDAHPQIASVGETAFKRSVRRRRETRQRCSCGETYFTCPFWQRVFRDVKEDGYDLSPLNWSNEYKYENAWLNKTLSRYSSRRVIRALQNAAAAALPFHRGRVRHTNQVNVSFIRAVLDVARAEVFFDASKAPMRLHHLLEIPELDIRVVRLVRDVRGFAGSAKRRGQPIEDAATIWKNQQAVIADVTRDLPPERSFMLRYEALCENPRDWFRRLYAFLGVEVVDPPETVVPEQHHVLGNRIRKNKQLRIRTPDNWRQALTHDEVSRVLRIAADANESLGYV